MKISTGKVIKWVAIILFALEVTGLLVALIVATETLSAASQMLNTYGNATPSVSASGNGPSIGVLLILLIAVGILFVKNLLIFGFGELIEHCAYTRYNTALITRYLDYGADIAAGTHFLGEKAAQTEALLADINERLAARKAAPDGSRAGTRIEWECPNCGTKNPVRAFFCMNCGTKGS